MSTVNIKIGGNTLSGVDTIKVQDADDATKLDEFKLGGGSSSIYKFYQEDGTTEITDITVAGLANAYYYTKNGGAQQRVGGRIYFINGGAVEGTDDKFYVYDTNFNSANEYTWATTTTSIADVKDTTAADSLGRGKQNTSIITGKNYGGVAWTYISSLNSSVYQGCNDWFIGSRLEYDMLRKSGISQAEAWFGTSGSYIWSSVESSFFTTRSWSWYYNLQYWNPNPKDNSYCVLPLRAF